MFTSVEKCPCVWWRGWQTLGKILLTREDACVLEVKQKKVNDNSDRVRLLLLDITDMDEVGNEPWLMPLIGYATCHDTAKSENNARDLMTTTLDRYIAARSTSLSGKV